MEWRLMCGNLIVLGVDLLAMHGGSNNDIWSMTMVTYVVLAKFTDQGIRNAKESPKGAEAFKRFGEDVW
jgi:hypothetical protein